MLGRLGDKALASRRGEGTDPPDAAPLAGTRAEAMQRLQVGLTGLSAMILVIAVASVLGGQADIAEDAAVPDAAPTTEPTPVPARRDPLVDAGVVPAVSAKLESEESETPDDPRAEDAERRTGEDRAGSVPDTRPAKRRAPGEDR